MENLLEPITSLLSEGAPGDTRGKPTSTTFLEKREQDLLDDILLADDGFAKFRLHSYATFLQAVECGFL